jgi:hypothetical protein
MLDKQNSKVNALIFIVLLPTVALVLMICELPQKQGIEEALT